MTQRMGQGGIPFIPVERHLPRKGFNILYVAGAVFTIQCYGLYLYIKGQRVVNAERRARAIERREFLETVDVVLREKYLQKVRRQAEMDIISMEELATTGKFTTQRPAPYKGKDPYLNK